MLQAAAADFEISDQSIELRYYRFRYYLQNALRSEPLIGEIRRICREM